MLRLLKKNQLIDQKTVVWVGGEFFEFFKNLRFRRIAIVFAETFLSQELITFLEGFWAQYFNSSPFKNNFN